jgi:UDP-N-acetylglucosamine--N-acetylmuramyl-(pentapeptide) pyrophosphoryl-undecaprenol N-acetylglucosamine transferase
LRILIACGGTGGHVYPALAIAGALRESHPAVELGFVGIKGGFEKPLVEGYGLPFHDYHEVRAGPFNGVNRLRQLRSLLDLVLGFLQSLWIITRRRPDAILMTGGWSGLPVALAGWVWRVPQMVYLPDIEPALTIRAVRPFTKLVALTTEASRVFFPKNQTVVTGYPIRPTLLTATRAAGIAHFHLDPTLKTLLVMGGSRGARAINNALLAILPELLADGVQIIHVTGTLDWEDIRAKCESLPDATHYHAYPYLHEEIGLGLAAADLALSRAGASVLGEYPAFGLPAVLVPLTAWRFQRVNADWLEMHGAALRLDENRLEAGLLSTLRGILGDEKRLWAMQAAARALTIPDGAARAAAALASMVKGEG